MRFIALAAVAATMMLAAPAAFAQPVPAAQTASSSSEHYSSAATPIGTLLDDPAAKAVLAKYVPQLVSSPQIDMARGMTLKDTQQYAPDQVSDDTLAKIDAELAKLPPKK